MSKSETGKSETGKSETGTTMASVVFEGTRTELDCGEAPVDKNRLIKIFDEYGHAIDQTLGFKTSIFSNYIHDFEGFNDPRRYDIKGNGILRYHCTDGIIEYRHGRFWLLIENGK